MERPSTARPRGVCRFYPTARGCREGDRCKFLHGPDETLTPYDKAKTCKFFAAGACNHTLFNACAVSFTHHATDVGYCTRGASCWFRHDRAEAQPASSTEPAVPEAEEDACSVCYEKPTMYGLLSTLP
jgi:E3 ubiquitin-protein ligase makorin